MIADLKINYKDAQYKVKKFNISNNTDGTVTLADATEYTVEGDSFGAKDINNTNERINQITHSWLVAVDAGGWSESEPYTKRIALDGMDSSYEPIMALVVPEGLTGAQTIALEKSYGCISRFTTGDGYIDLYCNRKKPSLNFNVRLKGV